MAGRMNWSRVAKERVVHERGHEPLAPTDRTIVQGRLAEKLGPKKKAKRKTAAQLAAEEVEREKRRIAARDRAQKQAARHEERVRAQLARKQEEARRKAEVEQRRAEHRARFEAMLATMTPEEKKAYFENQSRPRKPRRQTVVVEHRPLEKPTPRGKTGPSA